MNPFEALNSQFGTEFVSFEQGQGGLVRCQVRHPLATATIYLQGAHVTHFQPANQEPVLWMSDASDFREGSPIRGGIPICWPWFGPHPSEPELPQHGFARVSSWAVARVESDPSGVQLDLSLSNGDVDVSEQPFSLEYRIRISNNLRIELAATNIGNQSLTKVGLALHSYFAISDISDIRLEGLEEVPFFDKLKNRTSTETQSITISEETDRVYSQAPTVTMNDPNKNRRFTIQSSGSNSLVVWNPWIEKSQRMNDFPNEGYRTMVCVETANALNDVRAIEPSSTHTVTQTIITDQL